MSISSTITPPRKHNTSCSISYISRENQIFLERKRRFTLRKASEFCIDRDEFPIRQEKNSRRFILSIYIYFHMSVSMWLCLYIYILLNKIFCYKSCSTFRMNFCFYYRSKIDHYMTSTILLPWWNSSSWHHNRWNMLSS